MNENVYWSPAFERDPARAGDRERDWQDALIDALRTAVERRMVADVPVGVLLSGGIDSSLVVALLAEPGQHGLKTFSIGFDRSAMNRATSSNTPIWWRSTSTPIITASTSTARGCCPRCRKPSRR